MAETLSADAVADAIAPGGIDSGHTAWILMSCALVRMLRLHMSSNADPRCAGQLHDPGPWGATVPQWNFYGSRA